MRQRNPFSKRRRRNESIETNRGFMGSLIPSSFNRRLYVRQHRLEGNWIRWSSCRATGDPALSQPKGFSFRSYGEVTRKLIRAALAISILVGLSGCGQYQGWTRYECQLAENWEKPECNPPDCYVQGVCTKDILGDEINGKVTAHE